MIEIDRRPGHTSPCHPARSVNTKARVRERVNQRGFARLCRLPCILRAHMTRLAGWLVRHSAAVLVVVCAITVTLGVAARRLRVESSLESVLASGDHAVAYDRRLPQLFCRPHAA